MKRTMLPALLFFTCYLVHAQQKDIIAIQQLVKNYENAWNRHDPQALADNYDTNATWVNWFGSYYKGRDDIRHHYQIVHESYFKNTQYYTRAVEDITFLKPDIYVFPSDGVAYVITAICPPDKRTKYRPVFDAVAKSFKVN